MSSEIYFTIKEPSATEIRVKGSRFLAYLHYANSKEIAENIIYEVSRQHVSATHNCSVYRLGIGDHCIFRADDAGEPAGTAGKPILQALETRTVSDVVLVVTRYFGGIKLGIGGLIRAYSSAAFAVLDTAKLHPVAPMATIKLSFAYHDTGKIHKIVNTFHARILQTDYDDRVKMEIAITVSEKDEMLKSLQDVTRGKIDFEIVE